MEGVLKLTPHSSWVVRCDGQKADGKKCYAARGKTVVGPFSEGTAKSELIELALAEGWRPKGGEAWKAKKWLCPRCAAGYFKERSREMHRIRYRDRDEEEGSEAEEKAQE